MGFGGGGLNSLGNYSGIIMMLLMLAVLYFTAIRPQKKREKEITAMRDGLSAGDEVITIGGLHGKIQTVKTDYLILEMVPSKVKVKVSKWSVSTVVNSKAAKSEALEEGEDTVEESANKDIED